MNDPAPELLLSHTTQAKALALGEAVRRVQAGQTEAFRDIVLRCQAPLFGYLGRLGLEPARAQDVAQEALLRAWRSIGRFDPQRASFTTWLFTIARNLAWDDALRESVVEQLPSDDTAGHVAACGPTPEQALLEKRERLRLTRAIRRLPMADRSAIALAYVEGLDLASVAAIEQISMAALKTRLHRARHRLRELLESTHD